MNNIRLVTEKQHDNVLRLLFKSMYILMFAYLLFYPHYIGSLNGIVGRLTIMFNWATIIYILIISHVYNKFFLSWFVILNLIISVIISSEKIETNTLIQNIGSFLCMLLLIEAQEKIRLDKSLIKFITYFNIVICIIFVIYSNLSFAYRLETDDIYAAEVSLTLGYSNPNALSMILLYCLAVNLIAGRSKIYNRVLAVIMHIIYLYLIFKTNSRSSLLCALVLTVMSFITVKKIPKWILFLFMAIPIAYISLLPYLKSIGFMEDITILGKSIYTYREDMFVERMGYLEGFSNWTFGDFSLGLFSNHHNAALSIILSVGIFGLIIYGIIWCKNIIPYMKSTNRVSYIAICALLIFLLQSSTEAGVLVGMIPYYIMVVTLFMFARYNEDDIL